MEATPKKHVTQEEVDGLYTSLQDKIDQIFEQAYDDTGTEEWAKEEDTQATSEEGNEEEGSGKEKKVPKNGWDLSVGPPSLMGIHMEPRQTSLVVTAKNHVVRFEETISAGYENLPEFSRRLNQVTSKNPNLKGLPTVIAISGMSSRFMVAKIPKMAPAMMNRAFQLQLKQKGQQEDLQLSYKPLPISKKAKKDAALEHVVAGVPQSFMQKLRTFYKKHKIKVIAWDSDILSYLRGVGSFWEKERAYGPTRFLVILEWNECHLVIAGKDGQLMLVTLPIGIYSFLEHLAAALGEPTISFRWLSEKALTIQKADSLAVRQKKVMANQAIHALYVPVAQQIKTQLYTACNEMGIALPTHFTVVGLGAKLFRVADSLTVDLGLHNINLDSEISVQQMGALGASLWNKHPVALNCLPKGLIESIRTFRENMDQHKERLLSKLNKKKDADKPKIQVPTGSGKKLAFGGIAGVLACSYPLYQRLSVSMALSKADRKLASLAEKKGLLEEYEKREERFNNLVKVKKKVEGNRMPIGASVQEILSSLPPRLRLEGVHFDGNGFRLRGTTTDAGIIESFIRSSVGLKHVKDPVAVNITRQEKGARFELRFDRRKKRKK